MKEMETVQHFNYVSSLGHALGLSLYGAHLSPHAPCVLYLHGFKGFKDWGFVPELGHRMAANGMRLLAMNFSHNGIGAEGQDFTELEKFSLNTFSLEVEEAQEILEKYARGKLFGAALGAKLGVLGHSRGGGIALTAFCRHAQVEGICTWASVATFSRYPQHMIDEWREKGFLEVKNARTGQVMQLGWQLHEDLEMHKTGKLNIKQAVQDCDKYLCIIHGSEDEAVPDQDARAIFEWAENAKAEMHIIQGANHTFGARHPFVESHPHLEEAISHTVKFFKKILKA